MLNILKGVKFAQDDSTGDVYAVDCVDGPKKLSGGSGSGFEYDFIIKSVDGVSFTLETGTYEAINAKVGNQPVKGKIILNSEAAGQQKDMDCVFVGKNSEELLACAFMGEAYIFVVINTDNTVTSAG